MLSVEYTELAPTDTLFQSCYEINLLIIPWGPYHNEIEVNMEDSNGLGNLDGNPSFALGFSGNDEHWVDIFTPN